MSADVKTSLLAKSAAEDVAEVPATITLYGNYPNPFNPSTTLRYALPEAGTVSIDVFNLLGQKVAALAPGLQTAGAQQVTFSAEGLSSGVYFFRVSMQHTSGAVTQSSSVGYMILLK